MCLEVKIGLQVSDTVKHLFEKHLFHNQTLRNIFVTQSYPQLREFIMLYAETLEC